MARHYCNDCGKNRNHTSEMEISEGKLKILTTYTCSQGHERISETDARVTHDVLSVMEKFALLKAKITPNISKEVLLKEITELEDELIQYPHR